MALEGNRISGRAWMQSSSEPLAAARLPKMRELCFQLEIHRVASSNYLYSNQMSFLFLFECNLHSLICAAHSDVITACMRKQASFVCLHSVWHMLTASQFFAKCSLCVGLQKGNCLLLFCFQMKLQLLSGKASRHSCLSL